MNQREKELYLREYSLLKAEGKPFFPYAVAKDSLMACFVLLSIILMSLTFGAELGPKADPTTTTYVPRPEWYFFFLFEVLRVIKPAVLTPLATIGVPTICMILLFLLPFIDRGPERRPERRPIATITGIFVIVAMGYLTYLGAAAGSPNEIEVQVARAVRGGQARGRPVGLPRLPQDRRERQRRAGTRPERHRREAAQGGDPAHAREPHGADAVVRRPARGEEDRHGRLPRAAQGRRVGSLALMGSAQARTGTLEEGQVRAMFDRIARVYDRMNSVMTAGLHHRWRDRAAELAQVGPGDRALDVATGTGDLALALARRIGPSGEVVGSDFSEGMLELARGKDPSLRWEWGNALELPYADDEFDAATVGFGARNFSDLDRGLAEMARVVRPGGRVVVLEITSPQRPPLSTFFSLWFDRIIPALGRLTGDPEAYVYLPRSVKRFPGPEALAGRLSAAGLGDVRWILTAGGIIALHSGTVR